ncbi:MAG: L-2-hydroxyglutarate oxidase [Blastopirellula sp.]|nr:L-2-hydroxyglutarate oxidase [Blastopirellula sp.]
MDSADIAIIGGGIVGLASAFRITERFPDKKVIVIEKETSVGAHQSGHNSGVLHSGIYYKPGSLKAINCREGKLAMQAFCAAEDIPYDVCGKVIVAVDESERERLAAIYQRGQENGVACEMIGAERLAELEPHACGVEAIHVPEAGIVNYRRVCERLSEILSERGGSTMTGARVTAIRENSSHVVVATTAGDVEARTLINCAGLHCDRVTALAGDRAEAKIVPFRGEYYELKPSAEHLCRNLIYPVPDPAFPFLGVHFTRMIDGGVECGPNAVLAFAREGYRKWDINLRDLAESLCYPGFRRLAWKYWRKGLDEMHRSFRKAAFVHALQRLMPELESSQLVPARAGVRAQALTPDGALVDDFLIQAHDRIIHVNNAPSPAATSSLNIGKIVAEKLNS